MITKQEVIRAMNIVFNPQYYRDSATPVELQLAQSLKVYESRGEFDTHPGTGRRYEQAVECLKQAAYEIQE